jgi:hypothetical protein
MIKTSVNTYLVCNMYVARMYKPTRKGVFAGWAIVYSFLVRVSYLLLKLKSFA